MPIFFDTLPSISIYTFMAKKNKAKHSKFDHLVNAYLRIQLGLENCKDIIAVKMFTALIKFHLFGKDKDKFEVGPCSGNAKLIYELIH